jgi:hypothetical protein
MVVSVPRYDPFPEGTWAILIEAEIKRQDFVKKL